MARKVDRIRHYPAWKTRAGRVLIAMIFGLCLAPMSGLRAQVYDPDSLEHALANQDGFQRVNTGLFISRYYQKCSYPKAMQHIQATLALARQLHYLEGEIQALLMLSNIAYVSGNDAVADNAADKALTLARNSHEEATEASTLIHCARYYLSRGRHSLGYRLALEAVRKWESLGNVVAVIDGTIEIGKMHFDLDELEAAQDRFEAAAAMIRKTSSEKLFPKIVFCNARLRMRQKRYPEAHRDMINLFRMAEEQGDAEYLLQALRLLGEYSFDVDEEFPRAIEYLRKGYVLALSVNNKSEASIFATSLAYVHQLIGRYAEAIALDQEALKLRQAINNLAMIASTQANLGDVYMLMGDLPAAKSYFLAGFRLVENSDFVYFQKSISDRLYKLGKAAGDYAGALEYLEKSNAADGRLRETSAAINIASMDAKNELLRKTAELNIATLGKQRATLIFLLCSFMVFTCFGLIITLGYRRTRNMNRALEDANTALDAAVTVRSRDLELRLRENERDQQRLARSEARFHTIMDMSPDIIFIIDEAGNILFTSPAVERVHGYTVESMIGRNMFPLIHEDDIEPVRAKIREAMEREGTILVARYRVRNAAGSYNWMEATGCSQRDNPSIGGLIAISRNIDDRKRAELDLRDALREKNTALGEIHHRVKNNIQILSTLINLQADALSDATIIATLREIQGRVMSIGLVHEMLLHDDGTELIPVGRYLASLAVGILSAMQQSGPPIRLESSVDENVAVRYETAIPCGLIVNELITNSAKYAFHDVPSPCVRIEVSVLSDDRLLLNVADNGPGLPEGCDFHDAPTLGLRMVRILAHQLHGICHWSNENGACFSLEFSSDKSIDKAS